MIRQRWGSIVGVLVLLGACAAGMLAPAADGAKERKEKKADPCEAVGEPGGTTEAAGMAAAQPDEYAWQLFLFLNRQAKAGCAGAADPKKKTVTHYDPDRDVVWETWALASSEGSEVFLANGAKPVEWDKLDRSKRAASPDKLDVNMLVAMRRLLALGPAALRSHKPLSEVLRLPAGGVEVRMNRATFDTIRDRGWYARAGLADAYKAAKAANDWDYMQFRPMAKVVKAQWQPIDPARRDCYHWRTMGGQLYGLKALHVITKDLRVWFWCDFIHADLDPGEPVPSRDTTTRGPHAPHGHDGVRDETAGSKWAHYRLKGSQIAFTNARGEGTNLGNVLLEGGAPQADRYSCMTCHAQAVINDKATNQNKFEVRTGLPPDGAFVGPSKAPLLQTDFMWSLPLRAYPPPAAAGD
jgi:hypothetical protein